MTGRGLGYCASVYPGRRWGRGRCWGSGYSYGPVAPRRVTAQTEKEFLEAERALLKTRLEEIEADLEEH